MSEKCACGAAQNGSACGCGILQRGVAPQIPVWEGEAFWRDSASTMAADNARLCEIALKADALAKAARDLLASAKIDPRQPAQSRISCWAEQQLQDALDAYNIVRQGQ